MLHGGGPTAVLNASLAGVVEACRAEPSIAALYGAERGVEGLLGGAIVNLSAEDPVIWEDIARAPGSALGSSRRRITDADYEQMLATLDRLGVAWVLANGGNGTMEMALGLHHAARSAGANVTVVGIPKTIDNDLAGTDHTPGYASAGRFFASCLRDIGADNRALPGIAVLEVLGRNAGWLAAASTLARRGPEDPPHLTYFPERPLPFESLAADVDRVYRKLGRVVVSVCEGQLDENGEPFGADVRVSSRAPLALNLAHTLAQRLTAALKIPARSEKPGLFGRSCAALASEIDRIEARNCGAAAVRGALAGRGGHMVSIQRNPGSSYTPSYNFTPLEEVAGRERLFPGNWLPASPEDDLPAFRAWALPITGEIPSYMNLRRVRIF